MTDAAAPSAVRPAARPSPTRPWGFDPWLMITVGIMIVFGLVMVYSASWDVSYRLFGNPNALTVRQLSNLVIGLMVLAVAAVFPIRYLRRLATPIILGTIFILFVLLVVSAGAGPRRAFLAGSVQPSELAKLAVIIYLAVWMESKGERLSEWGYGFLPLMVIIGIVGGLILLQPDLSAVLTVASVALVMFYLAGAQLSIGLIGLFAVGMTGHVDVSVLAMNHSCAPPDQVGDDLRDRGLVSRDRLGRDQDGVSVAEFDEPVPTLRHQREGGKRLALAAGGDQKLSIRGKLSQLADVHQ